MQFLSISMKASIDTTQIVCKEEVVVCLEDIYQATKIIEEATGLKRIAYFQGAEIVSLTKQRDLYKQAVNYCLESNDKLIEKVIPNLQKSLELSNNKVKEQTKIIKKTKLKNTLMQIFIPLITGAVGGGTGYIIGKF